ncbi:MAG: fatty acyl-AMP ligase [Cyclobacteriaceae bacterium]|nr:fatty acyl-AMP ligase [Cyclobacteriaceae bacterium]
MTSKTKTFLNDTLIWLKNNPDQVVYSLVGDDHSTSKLTARELLQGVQSTASTLSGSKRALLIFDTGFEFVYGLLGCFLSRVVAIPIAIPKPKTQELFKHFLVHAQPDAIITSPSLRPRIDQLIPSDIRDTIKLLEVKNGDGLTEGLELPDGDDIALIQYTSGSTSQPKGVTISFSNLEHNLQAIKTHFGLNKESVCFSWLPHYHDMGLIDGLLSPLYNQCKGVIASPRTVVANPIVWLKAIENFRITHTGGPNFILDLCVDKVNKADAEKLDLSSLTHIYVSAEPVRKNTLDRFANHFKSTGFKSNHFTPGYGLAEATLMVTCKSRNAKLNYLSPDNTLATYVGLGLPIPGIDIQIIDPDSGQLLKEGQQGEIILHGPTITKGYFNDPEKTTEVNFTIDIDDESRTYLRTGDIGLLSGGELFVTGRLKDTIIIRGAQYFAEDLEYVTSLSSDIFLRSACAAFSIEYDQIEKIVIMQEVKKSADRFSSDETAERIRGNIFDHFGLSVHDILFMAQGSIPKTTSGKIRRGECKKLYLDKKLDDSLWH